MNFIKSIFIESTINPKFSVKVFNWLLVTGFVLISVYLAFWKLDYAFNFEAVYRYRIKFLRGWLMTIWISNIAMLISLLIGFACAILQRSKFLPLKYLCRLYIELVRGTPLLVQILIFFYVIAAAVSLNNRFVAGIWIMSLFAGAYIAEIIRGGLESIADSQLESARAVGFSRVQTYRYIIIPQVVKRILPALAGQFASLIKDSSLLSIIAIQEFTLNAQEVNAFTYSTLESYIPLALGYLILTLPISLYSRYLEKKTSYVY